MTAATAPLSPAAASALSAFLRGAERRALVMAELQTGDPLLAERAVAVAMRAFAGSAAGMAMVAWPGRFWALLCNTPALSAPPQAGHWAPELGHLQHLQPAERLALLLRIGAGLDEDAAATVLGVQSDAYRQALAGACPVDAQGYPDAAGWRALAEQVQQQIRGLAPARLQQLAQLRESSLPIAHPATPTLPTASPPAPARKRATRTRRPGYLWAGLAAALLLIVAAVWWWFSGAGSSLPDFDEPVAREGAVLDAAPARVEELPLSRQARMPAAADVHATGDAAMLADPDLALARDADFYAWFAAGGPIPVDESQSQPMRPAPAAAGLETVDVEE